MEEETAAPPVNEPATYQPPEIDMIPVDSTAVAEVGHDGASTLRVKYHKSAPYDYPGVPEEKFFELVNSESIGRALPALLKELGIKGVKLLDVKQA